MSNPYTPPPSELKKPCFECKGTGFKPPPPKLSECLVEGGKTLFCLGLLFLAVYLSVQALKHYGVINSVQKVKRVVVTEITIGEYTWELD